MKYKSASSFWLNGILLLISLQFLQQCSGAQDPLRFAGHPAELTITPVSDHTLRITLEPTDDESETVPVNDGRVLVSDDFGEPIVQISELRSAQTLTHGDLRVRISSSPLTIDVTTSDGEQVQHLVFDSETGRVDFNVGNGPVFGLGNGGQFFDRRGTFYSMERGHLSGEVRVFGARTPVPFLIGTEGWSMFFHRPYNGHFDLRDETGHFIPAENGSFWRYRPPHYSQMEEIEGSDADKIEEKKEYPLPLDLFITHVDSPSRALSEYTMYTGKPAMPPKWALGYMQSHRGLKDPDDVMEVARTFRERELPVDALIYLGTGFTPNGWNTGHGEFEFNPEIFDRPQAMIDEMQELNYKLVLHITRPPQGLRGHISTEDNETPGPDHVESYWEEHREVFDMGIAGWWPDMGDPLDNDARLTRHYLYYEGSLTDRPDERPWSLHRTGFAGMHRYGGWIWTGDPASAWETLHAHVPSGINASLSTSPFWGTDIGGFYPTNDFTGELYVRWFQFGAFTPSFRSHGVVWRTRLPWGWNPGEEGPLQLAEYLKGESASVDLMDIPYERLDLHTTRVEPIIKEFLELRYRLMPYLYSIVREAHDTGLPPMRALWLHYPDDPEAVARRHEYLWGRDMLIAPITEKGTMGQRDLVVRELYLPEGKWYNFWSSGGGPIPGRQHIREHVGLDRIPIYVRAGTILPVDPVRQYVYEPAVEPTELWIYPGTDGHFSLYEDDGKSMAFRNGDFSRIQLTWDDEQRTLSIEPGEGAPVNKTFRVMLMDKDVEKTVEYIGEPLLVDLNE